MNPNLIFLLDIALLFGGTAYAFTLVRLRAKRESLLSQYKPGTKAYKSVKASLSIQRLVLITVAIALIVVKTVFDIKAIIRLEGDSAVSTILFIVTFAVFLSVLIAVAVYRTFLWNKLSAEA